MKRLVLATSLFVYLKQGVNEMTLKKRQWLSLTIIAIFLLSFSLEVVGHAKEKEGKVSLSVRATLPDNQIESSTGFFDLKVKAGNKQKLEVVLTNTSEEQIKAKISVRTATTGLTGSIDYGQVYDPAEKDSTLLYPMTEILTPAQEIVEIPAKGEAKASLNLKVPAEEFNGVLLGGIRVEQVIDESQKSNNDDQGVVIKNRFAYNLAVRLTETDEEVTGNLKSLGVKVSQMTGRNMVLTRLQNTNAQLIEKVSYEGHVTKKGSSEVLHESNVSNYRVAPNSTYYFPIDWENQRFEAGEYVLKAKAESKETGDVWEFTEEFTITREDAKKFNETAVDLPTDYTKWLWLAGGVAGLLVLLTILIVLITKSRKKKRLSLQKRKRKSSKSSSKKSRSHSSKTNKKRN